MSHFLTDNKNAPPYQQLFELDELLVEILRHLLDDKKSINQLILTAKWLAKRLHSTALWTSIGALFYNHDGNTISTKILWHLLRDRQIELDLQSLKQLSTFQEDTTALEYLINLARSDSQAHLMVNREFLRSPLYDISLWRDKPKHQRLVCVLLGKLFTTRSAIYIGTVNQYVPVFVEMLKNNEEQLESPLALAAFKALRGLLSKARTDTTTCKGLYLLGPIITKLMTHENEELQQMGFSIAGTIASAATRDLVTLPGIWPAIVNGLSSETESIRKDTARILANFSLYDEILRTRICTEEIFTKLLALRSDTLDVTYEVMGVFKNLGENNSNAMNEAQQQMCYNHFDDLLDLCEKRLNAALKANEENDHRKSMSATVAFLCGLMDVVNEFPNKEILRQKFLQSTVLQLVRTLDISKILLNRVNAL